MRAREIINTVYRVWYVIYCLAYAVSKLGDFIEAIRDAYDAIKYPDADEGKGEAGDRRGRP